MEHWNGVAHMAGMWLWWLAAVAIVAVIVWATVWTSSRSRRDAGESAESVLKRRYAQGEIDKDDYEERLRDLRR